MRSGYHASFARACKAIYLCKLHQGNGGRAYDVLACSVVVETRNSSAAAWAIYVRQAEPEQVVEGGSSWREGNVRILIDCCFVC